MKGLYLRWGVLLLTGGLITFLAVQHYVQEVRPILPEQLLRDRLEPGHHHDHDERKLLPDVDDHEGWHDPATVVEDDERVTDPAPGQELVADQAVVGVQHPLPDVRRGDGRDHPRD